MATATTNLVFIPWLRRGLAASIVRPDQPPTGTVQPVVKFGIEVTMGSNVTAVDLPLVGPGDIAGLDSRVIVRTAPGRDESDAEFKHFVSVEFDQADLPWRYTPAAPLNQKLHPWLTLIVLKDDEWSPVQPTSSQKLPIATVQIAALPPLLDGWACGHVQLHGDAEFAMASTDALAAVLNGRPGQFVARLLCTRVLSQQTRYTAMLVPTYERGRVAGLGDKPDDNIDALTFAWEGNSGSKTLPIYYQWRFQTGVVGSFKDLARVLKPQPIPGTVGRRALDVSKPGFDLPSAAQSPSTALQMQGALQSLQASQLPAGSATGAWVSAIQSFVNTQKTTINNGTVIPLVAPPLYGRWYAAETQLGTGNKPWFSELNSDPRNRTLAGLGTLMVQERHQELMASAWEQIEGLLDAINERKMLQLGRAAFNQLLARHFLVGSKDSQLLALGGLQRWTLRAAGDVTIHSEFAGSVVRRSVFDPQFRRLARPRGPIARRQLRQLAPVPIGPVTRLATDLQPAPPKIKPTGMATPSVIFRGLVPGNLKPPQIATVTAQGNDPMLFWGILLFCVARRFLTQGAGRSWWWLVRVMRFAIGLIRLAAGTSSTNIRVALRDGTLTQAQVLGLPGSANFTLVPSVPATAPAPPLPTGTDNADAAAFRQAWARMLDGYATPGVPVTPPAPIDVTAVSSFFMTKLSPNVTLTESTIARLKFAGGVSWQPADPLDPVQLSPTYDQPMWTQLRDDSIDWILPNVEQVVTNSVGLVVSNQKFIESYMVGLNHEMSRTLLWNGFPTDQRGTYFRQFWDSRAAAGTGDLRDIKAIVEWTPTNALGANSARAQPSALVLLVRADLIRRYPNTVVYALQPPSMPPAPSLPQTAPVFRGLLTKDIGFYGFPIPQNQGGSYAFVLQEQPAEPHFGVEGPGVPVNPPGPVFVSPMLVGATSAADFASKTKEDPVRVVIPGAMLVPST
jgi:hypothetical protein